MFSNRISIPVVLTLFLAGKPVYSGLLEQANELFSSGKTIEAISAYRKAALEGENPALCYFNMANAYFQIDSIPQSIVYYKSCIGYAPDFFRAHLNIAIAYYSINELGECIAHISRALDLEQGDEKALLICAAAFRSAGANPEAAATFEQLLLLHPDNDDAYLSLAEIYREIGDPDEAVKWLTKYPKDGKNEPYINIMLAEMYEEREDLARAIYHLKQCWDKDTSKKWAFHRIVTLMLKQGNNLVALEQAENGLSVMPNFAELALLAGNIAFEAGLYDKAERLYSQARENGSAGAVIGLENIRLVRSQVSASAE
jgi:tetratricopeptide (TPR) repeat protein